MQLGTLSLILTVSHFRLKDLGVPVKYFPDDPEKMPAVQYAALVSDLVVATKKTLGAIATDKDPNSLYLEHLRMRTS